MEILNIVFNMSITGSLMFFIFILLKPITKKHFNSSWHYIMLILILTFFIIPVGNFIRLPISPIANMPKLEVKESVVLRNRKEEIKDVGNYPRSDKEILELEHREAGIAKDKDPNLIKREDQDFQKTKFNISNYKFMVQYIWVIGVILLILFKIIPYIRFKSLILKNSRLVGEEDVLNLFNLCKNELDLKAKIELRTCSIVSSPMLVGLFCPMVLIPKADIDYKRLSMIFLHELNHYKRKDIMIKALGLIINGIHWFNPLIYIVLKEMDKYCEYSIDEKVVVEMDISDRKYYGETILSLIGNSIFKKTSLTTAMGSHGKQLKTRLENMIYSFKPTRKKQVLSLFMTTVILVSGFLAACSVLPNNTSLENESFVVYIKEDGLYYSHLNGEGEARIHEGNGFEYPLVSSRGNYIAYTKEASLFIYSIKDKNYEKIEDGISHYYRSYAWLDDISIIYGSDENPGFTVLNVISKERMKHSDEFYYTDLVPSKNNMVYGVKSSRWTRGEEDFTANDGIVEINLDTYNEKRQQFSTGIILEGRRSTDEIIGYNPLVWDISNDGSYVYIMEKPASGSLSTDLIGIGVYDAREKTHTEFADIDTLAYKNHLTINPSNNMIGLVEGAGRDMIKNKKLTLLNINKDKSYDTVNVTGEDMLVMTPSFTLDGKKLLYSAIETIDSDTMTDYNEIYNKWENQPYSIYEYDLESSQVRRLTQGNNFEFMPIDISNNEILFTRYRGNDYYSLVKLVNGKENIIADDIIFDGGKDNNPFGLYGHIQTERGMDIFIGNNKSKKENIATGKVDELYKLRGSYIGDNSKVSNIINLLDFPEELLLNGVELFTKEEPFGLEINFQASDEIISKYMSTSSDYVWRPQSLVLFSLIDNLEYIQYGINSDDLGVTVAYINRQVADSLTNSRLGYKLSELASSKQVFEEFYKIYATEYSTQTNKPEGFVGHLVVEDDTLHFREVEIVEIANKKRVEELGLSESDFPNGYSIIPKNNGEMSFELTDETIYTFTDIYGFFVNELDGNRLYTTIRKDEFLKHLGKYDLNEIPLSKQTLPYFIEVIDGKVISITEKFKYTI